MLCNFAVLVFAPKRWSQLYIASFTCFQTYILNNEFLSHFDRLVHSVPLAPYNSHSSLAIVCYNTSLYMIQLHALDYQTTVWFVRFRFSFALFWILHMNKTNYWKKKNTVWFIFNGASVRYWYKIIHCTFHFRNAQTWTPWIETVFITHCGLKLCLSNW